MMNHIEREKGRWVKGHSGNPGGKTNQGTVLLRELAIKFLPELFDIALDMVRNTLVKDHVRASLILAIFDRVAGKPIPQLNIVEPEVKEVKRMTGEEILEALAFCQKSIAKEKLPG